MGNFFSSNGYDTNVTVDEEKGLKEEEPKSENSSDDPKKPIKKASSIENSESA